MKNRLFIAVGVAFPLLILIPLVFQKTVSFAGLIPADLRILLTTDEETRRLRACGDFDNMGYGYLKRITDRIPDRTIYPVTRLKSFYPWTHLLLPGRRDKPDDRLLVGIDIGESDLREGHVANAVSMFRQGGNPLSVWAFMTDLDYDRMTGVRIGFETLPSGPVRVQGALLRSNEDRSVIGEWAWPAVAPGEKVFLKLDPPVDRFSFGRGSTPFVLMLKTALESGGAVPLVRTVEITGIKINLESYTIIHTDHRSFTAVRNDFFRQITSAGAGPWMDFLIQVRDLKSGEDRRNG
ncbi:MAG TPA: hypothetical protein PKL97_03685 [Candidatus Omnitrophota bacterium]|nr:hypothetical protein [Candidatus Omnitrophota bacterium]